MNVSMYKIIKKNCNSNEFDSLEKKNIFVRILQQWKIRIKFIEFEIVYLKY